MATPDDQMPPEAVESLTESFSESFSEFSDSPAMEEFLKAGQSMREEEYIYEMRPGPHSDTGAPPPPSRILNTPIIDLVLSSGTRETHYAIHKGLLEYHSSTFRAALSETWHDSTKPAFEITGHEKETIDTFVEYIYFGSTHTFDVTSTCTNKDIRVMINAWIFADKYLVPGFQNWILNQIMWSFTGPSTAKLDRACPYEHFDYITKHTAPTSDIRRLFVDIAAAICKPLEGPWLDNVSGPMFAELLQLLLQKSQYTALKTLWIRLSHPCFYHRHDDGKQCSCWLYSGYVPSAWQQTDVKPRLETTAELKDHPDIQRLEKLGLSIYEPDYALPRWTVIPGLAPAGQVFELLARFTDGEDCTYVYHAVRLRSSFKTLAL